MSSSATHSELTTVDEKIDDSLSNPTASCNCMLSEYIEHMFSRTAFPLQSLPRPKTCFTVFISGGRGGHTSLCAILTLTIIAETGILLIGFDKTPSGSSSEIMAFLESYFSNLADHPIFPNSVHVLVTDNPCLVEESTQWVNLARKLFLTKDPQIRIYRYSAEVVKRGMHTDDVKNELTTPYLIQRLMKHEMYCVSDLVVSELSLRECVIKSLKSHLRDIQSPELHKHYGESSFDNHGDVSMGIVKAVDVICDYMKELHLLEAICMKRRLEQYIVNNSDNNKVSLP